MKKRVIIGGLAGATAASAIVTALTIKSRNDLFDQHARLLVARVNFEAALTSRRDLVRPLLGSIKGVFSEADYQRQAAILSALVGPNVHPGSDAILATALLSFFKLAEDYISLRSNPGFLDAREQLEAEAYAIGQARSRYLAQAREYNGLLGHKRGALVARIAGLSPEDERSIEEA